MRCPLMYRNVLKRSFESLTFVAIPLLIAIVHTTAQSSSSLPPVIRHPGTCTFQRSQSACTFSLLCYLAGGTPLEGCGGDFSTTCCMLHNSQYSSQSPPHSSPPPPPFHPNPSPNHSRYLTSNSNPHQSHDFPERHRNYDFPDRYPDREFPEPDPYHFGRTTPPATEFIDYGLDHNTIRRTRPDGHFKAFFREVSSRKAYGRNLQEDICGRPSAKPINRIIGGQDAYFGEFPWQVHIKITKHQCGGALVNQQFIVTAAHCIYQAPIPQLNVIIGAHDIEDQRFQDIPPQYFGVTEVKLHPNFRFSASHPDRYDIAVLRLDRPVRYNDNVLPVCLPQQGFRYEGWYGVVTGWGKTDPALSNRYGTRLLQKVDVPIINNEECEMWHRTRGIDLRIFPEMMCAGYEDGRKDACVGDSGGPLVINTNGRWTLAGITSAGFGCAQSRQPGIYHRVSNTVDWIIDNIKN